MSDDIEFRGTVELDERGVWVHEVGGWHLLIDQRPLPSWQVFVGHEVIIAGDFYSPFDDDPLRDVMQFTVHTLRLVDETAAPISALGNAEKLRGKLSIEGHPAGSKLAGSTELVFTAGGTRYTFAGADVAFPPPGDAELVVRPAEPSRTYAATTGGPKLWLISA